MLGILLPVSSDCGRHYACRCMFGWFMVNEHCKLHHSMRLPCMPHDSWVSKHWKVTQFYNPHTHMTVSSRCVCILTTLFYPCVVQLLSTYTYPSLHSIMRLLTMLSCSHANSEPSLIRAGEQQPILSCKRRTEAIHGCSGTGHQHIPWPMTMNISIRVWSKHHHYLLCYGTDITRMTVDYITSTCLFPPRHQPCGDACLSIKMTAERLWCMESVCWVAKITQPRIVR